MLWTETVKRKAELPENANNLRNVFAACGRNYQPSAQVMNVFPYLSMVSPTGRQTASVTHITVCFDLFLSSQWRKRVFPHTSKQGCVSKQKGNLKWSFWHCYGSDRKRKKKPFSTFLLTSFHPLHALKHKKFESWVQVFPKDGLLHWKFSRTSSLTATHLCKGWRQMLFLLATDTSSQVEWLQGCIKMSTAYLVKKTKSVIRGFGNCPPIMCAKAIKTDKIGWL